MKRLELLIPPPLVMLLTGLLMWWVSTFSPALPLDWRYRVAAAASLGLLGLVISLAGVITFRRARTTMDPRHIQETSALVSSGVYRYSRNPMYVGILFVLIGWGVYLDSFVSILCTLLFVAYITRFQIIPEERWLRDKFGTDFQAYQDGTRRWL